MFRNFLLLLFAVLLLPAPVLAAEPAEPLEKQVLEIIQRHPEAVYNALRTYKLQADRAQQLGEWRENLKKPIQVNIAGAPVRGRMDAPLTLVEFSDFQCPFCGQAQSTLRALESKYKDQLRVVYLNLPLPIHPQAQAAALAAWAAGRQGRFFEYHDRLFALNENLQADSFESIARDLGLDLAQFNRDRESPEALARVAADVQQAIDLKLDSTPSFVLNGVLIKGARPLADFEEVIKLVRPQPG
ncbi:DsbA family protein [Gloeobacter kilaueensis]|uniref:DSBA oxidoreductase n=1 Tax=Gloeobacter kilaueensis (strain ATCC BAA-2537 / CCAP 1431/1 / ULC 316 / JS1) TaxID=1183438 RepID=U5QKR5_GLOK1|nr:thioredoxin domain-containing protein [Gloeobacter kilaueensis]AGY58270.1 DSBA oxidoreductase [Gloeobacter kilaueensis JS1]